MGQGQTERRPEAGGGPEGGKAEVGSRQHLRQEAVEKNQASVDAIVQNPGAPPDPGMQEDYGLRSGDVPSEEPGNPENDKPRHPT